MCLPAFATCFFRLIKRAASVGVSVNETSSETAIANLEYESVKHVAPVFHGDTIYAESTILGKEASGIVAIESRGVNQRGEPILTLRRKIEVPRA